MQLTYRQRKKACWPDRRGRSLSLQGSDIITDYLFLGPDREVPCGLEEIRRYVEEHYEDRRNCPRCGCYLIPAVRSQRFLCRVYRCANSICSGSLRTFRIWPYRSAQVA